MQEYIIQPNDTLFFIAKQFGVPLVQLINANPELANPNMIYIGQIIEIPELLEIPNQIDIIETNAEEIINDIYEGDWEESKSMVEVIKTNRDELLPLLQEAYVPYQIIYAMNEAIKNLEQNIMQQKIYPAISQSNQITRYVPDLLDYFKVVVPTDVKRLAYLARQIIINIESNDWNEAKNNYNIEKRIWGRLKPEMDTKYSKDIVEFDMLLDDFGRSINQKNYQSTIENALKTLDILNILENDFEEQSM